MHFGWHPTSETMPWTRRHTPKSRPTKNAATELITTSLDTPEPISLLREIERGEKIESCTKHAFAHISQRLAMGARAGLAARRNIHICHPREHTVPRFSPRRKVAISSTPHRDFLLEGEVKYIGPSCAGQLTGMRRFWFRKTA